MEGLLLFKDYFIYIVKGGRFLEGFSRMIKWTLLLKLKIIEEVVNWFVERLYYLNIFRLCCVSQSICKSLECYSSLCFELIKNKER